MTRNLRKPLICAAVLALVVFTVRPGQAQTGHNDMAAMKQGMGGHMTLDKASQQKLDDLVATMNQASGDDKVNKLAAVVSELVAQHRDMCARMMSGNMMMPMSMMKYTPEANTPAPTAKPEDDHATHPPKP